MNREGNEELRRELERLLTEFEQGLESDLAAKRRALDDYLRNIIELYQNSIRNLGAVSGIVAPFSLTLLGVNGLNINSQYLILGFVLLMGNIVFSQLLLHVQLDLKNNKRMLAELDWISATTSRDVIADTRKDINERVLSTSEYVSRTTKLSRFLGQESYDIDLIQTGALLQRYNSWVNTIFAIGCGCIIISTFFNPLTIVLAKEILLVWR